MEVGAGVILLAAASYLRRGSFTIGDFILFSSYQAAVLGIFRWGGTFLGEIRRNDVSIDRMECLMNPEPPLAPVRMRKLSLAKVPEMRLSIDRGEAGPLELLEVGGLSFRYSFHKAEEGQEERRAASEDGQEARQGEVVPFGIESMDFSLAGGSLTVITGPIGSGKTTLLKSLLGLLPAKAEKLSWNGREVPASTELERSRFWRAPRSAYTPQVPRLFSDSIKGNILLGIPEEESDLPALLAQACLEPRPQGNAGRARYAHRPEGVSGFQAGRSRGSPPRACSRGAHRCTSLTISRAPSTWRPRRGSGTG